MIRKKINNGARLALRRLPQAPIATGSEPAAVPSARAVECGWGRLIAGHTFASPQDIATALLQERPEHRDIAFYVEQPHVGVAHAPQRLFVEDAPVTAFAPGSIARLHAHAGRWWGQWGRLESRLEPPRPPVSAPAGRAPGG